MAYIPTVEEFNENYPVARWDRNTVADGKWLQENTIGPLSARDDFLLSLFEDLEGGDSWKKWSEKHNSSAEYSAVASAIYIGPNNKILGSGHAYVVGENNTVSATTNKTSDSRGGSYVFGMDNYVNDGFVIGNQVTANMGSKVIGRDVSATKCSTVIGYNVSADDGSLALTTPTSNSSKKIVDGGSLLISIADCDKPVVSKNGSINISRRNASAIAGGILIGGEDAYIDGSLGFGRAITASGGGTIIGSNGNAGNGSIIIKNGGNNYGNYSYAEQYGIVIGNGASAKHGALAISINNNGNIYSENGGIAIGTNASAEGGAIAINGYVSTHSYAGPDGLVLNPGHNYNSYAANLGFVFGGGSAQNCAAIIGNNNIATYGSYAFGVENNVSYGSFSFGFRNIIDHSATNFGEDNSASNMATVFGNSNEVNNNSFNFGNYNTVNGYSINLGNNNSATEESVTFGNNNSANNNSFNFGNTNIVDNHSINFGSKNVSEKHSVTFGDYNTATTCSFIFGDFNKAKLNIILGLNNNAIASISNNYYILSAERYSDGKPILTGDGVSTKTYEPYGFIAGDNNISQTYSPIIIGVANSAALSGGFGDLANYDTTGYMTPNYPIAIGIGNKAYRNFDTTIGSYNVADGGSNLVYGDWCSAVGNHNTILNGYNSVVRGKDNLIVGSDSKLLVYTNGDLINTSQGFDITTKNILYWSKLNATIKFEDSWICENILRKSDFDISATEDRTFFTNNKINESKIDIKNDDYDIWFCGNEITGGNVNINTNQYTMFNYNKIRLGNKAENTLNIPECSEHQIYITNNNIDYYGHNGKTFNIIKPFAFNFNDFKYNRSINLPDNVNIFNVKTNRGFVVENNIYQTVFDINLSAKPNYDTSEFVSCNNLLFTKFICNIDKFKQYNLPRFYMNNNTPTLDAYKLTFTNSYVYGGSILNSDRVISFATENALDYTNEDYTTIANSKNIINLGDDNEISASIETISFGKMNNIVGGHKTTIFGNENIAYITPVEVDSLVTDVESYAQYSGMLPGLYDTNIIGSYNSFMSDVEFDPNEDKHANTIARNFILGYHNDIKVHNFITDNVIIGNNNKTVYESNDYSDQLYRNKIIGNNNSASNQFADCNILGDNNELNNNSEIVFENDTIIGMHNKVEFGSNSTLIGHHNIVSGYNSVLIGEGLSATNSQVVVGRFNEVLPGTDDRNGQDVTAGALFIVGNGSHTDNDFDNPTRSNAMVVSADGTVSAKTYKADPTTPLGKLFNFLSTATLEIGTLKWTGSDWTIQQ